MLPTTSDLVGRQKVLGLVDLSEGILVVGL